MLEEKLQYDLREAMKAKDLLKVSVIRMLRASIGNTKIEKRVTLLEDGDIFQIITKQIKQHRDSIEAFKKGNRADLVEKESKELEILNSYLPEQLSAEEIVDIVKAVISQTGASSRADLGKVMKEVMAKVKGRADGRVVSQIVGEQFK